MKGKRLTNANEKIDFKLRERKVMRVLGVNGLILFGFEDRRRSILLVFAKEKYGDAIDSTILAN